MNSPNLFPSIISFLLSIFASKAVSVIDSQSFLHEDALSNVPPFDDKVSKFMEARSIPGLSLAITKDDRLVYASGYGYSDISTHTPVSTSDRFRIASVSKSLTAITIMHLHEQGVLSIFDPIFGDGGLLGTKYGDEAYSDYELNITVQHLLEHTSGFVDRDMCGHDCDPTYLPKWLDLDQWDLVSAILDAYDPTHEPGTHASYSNFGYFILGRIVEEVTGVMPYGKYVQERVLAPLGIMEMRIGRNERLENEVVYYDGRDPEKPYSFHIDRRDSVGAWIATPTDLLRMLTAVDGLEEEDGHRRRHFFLNETTRDLMFEKSTVNGSMYAKGWTVHFSSVGNNDDEELDEAEKDGGYWGTNSWVSIKFNTGVSYAVVVNKECPKNNGLGGARDMKLLLDDIVDGIEEWPDWNLF